MLNLNVKRLAQRLVTVSLAALLVNGCSISSSMRIEVDVYKGLLTQTKEAHHAQITALTSELRKKSVVDLGCATSLTSNSAFHNYCYSLHDQLKSMNFQCGIPKEETSGCASLIWQLRSLSADSIKFLAVLEANPKQLTPNSALKSTLRGLVVLSARYADPLESRVAAIDAARDDRALDKLSTASYLREASSGSAFKLAEYVSAEKISGLNTAEKTRLADEFLNESSWARVNEVYASGAGDVSMAFIRDGIGNWNLKNFKNDPADMNRAFADVATKLIQQASGLATGGKVLDPKALEQIPKLLSAANGTQTGKQTTLTSGAIIAGLDLEKIRSDLKDQLNDIKDELKKSPKLSAEEQSKLEQLLLQQASTAPTGDNEIAAEPNPEIETLQKKKADRSAAEQVATTKAAAIVERYALIIEAAQRVSAAASGQQL